MFPTAPLFALVLTASAPTPTNPVETLAVLPVVDLTTGAADPELSEAATTAARALAGVQIVPPEAVEAALKPVEGSTNACDTGTLAHRTALDCLPALSRRLGARLVLSGQAQIDDQVTSVAVDLFDAAAGRLLTHQSVSGTAAARLSDPEAAAASLVRRVFNLKATAQTGRVVIHAPEGWSRDVDGIQLAPGTDALDLAEGTHWVEAAPSEGNLRPSRGSIDVLASETVAYEVLSEGQVPAADHRHVHVGAVVGLLLVGGALTAGCVAGGIANEHNPDINEGNAIDAAATIGLNIGVVVMTLGVAGLVSGR